MNYYVMKDYLELLSQYNHVTECNLYNKEDQIIKYLTYDSRAVTNCTLFVCKGNTFKSEYLELSVKNGATLYISEIKYELPNDIPYIIVKDIRKAMPCLAKKFFNNPASRLNLIGIGGTKGKSTTAYFIKSVIDEYLAAMNKPESAVLSSIDQYDGVIRRESHITTPESIELFQHFRNAVESGINFLEMEVSSQALKYNRVDEVVFDIGVFLNISEDHISPLEHPDFEDYFSSKLSMFAQTKTALVSTDSDYLERILDAAKAAGKVVTFGTKIGSDVYGYDIKKIGNEIIFSVKCDRFEQEFRLTIPGLFNVENALAAIAIANEYEIPLTYIYQGLYKARSDGRMEAYTSADNKVIAIVDYAHNKLSFDKLFESTLKEYPDYNIVSIFGCPGKKALGRRQDLGRIAGMYSKKIYLVAEDPGAEPVTDISRDIAQYVAAENCPYEMIEDRGEAIRKAILEVKDNTVILITGKGNETRQKYGNEYIDCPSDVDFTKKALEEYDLQNKLMTGLS